jgi:hypothetical protein
LAAHYGGYLSYVLLPLVMTYWTFGEYSKYSRRIMEYYS